MKTWYAFSQGKADGNRDMRDLLGGKGANLAEMCLLGIPVPPGFTLPTTLCLGFYGDGEHLSRTVLQAIDEGIRHIETVMSGPRFGDPKRPLLVSVRSGARASMPGMMDTVLNLGLTETTLPGLVEGSGSRRFALDAYRRLIVMYGDVVMGAPREVLEEPLAQLKKKNGFASDRDLDVEHLEHVIEEMLAAYERHVGAAFPQDPHEQLRTAVAAVFKSWNGKRAKTYRQLNGIPDDWGTAANVQAMVFGNFGDTSATGVAFTRNPSTGQRWPFGEWLPNAQGEDVVAGVRTPGPLLEVDVDDGNRHVGSLEKRLPEAFAELMSTMQRLEQHFRDMQDVEFTVQEGKLYMLQTRTGKRTAAAALRCAVDMSREKLIDRRTAVSRVTPQHIDQLMHPQIDLSAPKVFLAKGLPASPGAASGSIVLTADEAEERAGKGEAVMLVRQETSPEDIHGMHAARGILTATGGMTSHAAVVARGMGRACVSGCSALYIDAAARTVRFATPQGERVLRAGDAITIDGSTGAVYEGVVPTVRADVKGDFATLLGWADELRSVGVRANADTPEDAANAVRLGAQGIGLCRTEHMFFAPERIRAMREMILAETVEQRRAALKRLEPMQRADFEAIFRVMAGKPVTIRLLDPPLHEFLPHTEKDLHELAQSMRVPVEALRAKNEALREANPMLGHRGCRLGITYPEIYEMQARAILEAACHIAEQDVLVLPEIMIPLVATPQELDVTRRQIEEVAKEVFARNERSLPFLIGTMIELPRAALVADEIARHADFFSFGTNDLTQTTLGISRDDGGRFVPAYVAMGIFSADPFASLDTHGVGQLVRRGTELGRQAKPGLKVGVCGEHGGDPASIEFFVRAGLDYVSCSPYRVPVARLAAAHAALQGRAGAEERDV